MCALMSRRNHVARASRGPVSATEMKAVGSLMHLSVTVRPDITYAVGVLARCMASPTRVCCEEVVAAMNAKQLHPGMVCAGLLWSAS